MDITQLSDEELKQVGGWVASLSTDLSEDSLAEVSANLSGVLDGEEVAEALADPEAVDKAIKAEQTSRDKLRKAQMARSKKYGIEVLADTNLTIPKRFADMGAKEGDFADIVNYKYPVWLTVSPDNITSEQLGQVRNAMARFTQSRKVYSSASQDAILARIEKARKKFGVGQRKPKEKKSVSLTDQVRKVRRAWEEQNRPNHSAPAVEGETYAVEVFDDGIIVSIGEKYFKVPYVTNDSGDVEFADRTEWAEVQPQKTWIEKVKGLKAAVFDIEASCQKKAIKILDHTSREIGMYATVWGEADCEDDRMTRKAIEPYIGQGHPLMLWKHGLDPKVGSALPGKWNTDAFRLDDVGLWAVGNIGTDEVGDYVWERITTAGSVGASVGSAWYLVKRKKSPHGGMEIIDWPLLEISIMEGGKQCVPSAYREVKAELLPELTKAAQGYGIKLKELDIMGQDIEALVAERIEAELKRREEEAREKAEQEAKFAEAVAAKAAELALEKEAAIKANLEAEIEEKVKARVDEKVKKAIKERPSAPPGGAGDQPLVTFMATPHDRLSTFDLAMRYEILRSYGKRPSQQFWRALATRAVKMARSTDTLYIRHGQPVKVPQIDWEVITPKDLYLGEVDDDVFALKQGPFDRFIQGGFDRTEDPVSPQGTRQLAALAIKANEVIYSTQANAGDEWVPTLMAAELWRTIRLNAAVLGVFDQFDMPSQPFDYPTESTDPTFYKVGETTDESQLVLTGGPFSDSKIGTAKTTFTAGKLGALSYWTEELEEDAILAVEPQFRDQYGVKMAHAIDDVLLNGDETTGTTNISDYGGTIATSSRYLVIDGLRHRPLVTTTTDATSVGTLTTNDFATVQALMGTAGKYGVNPADLVFFMDTGVYHKAKMLSEVLTLDQFGSAATIITGQLAGLMGVPIVVSEDYPLTDTSGYQNDTAGNNTKGSFLCVNKRGFKVGWRRRPRVRVVGLPGAEARYIVGSARFEIQHFAVGMAGMGYNVTI